VEGRPVETSAQPADQVADLPTDLPTEQLTGLPAAEADAPAEGQPAAGPVSDTLRVDSDALDALAEALSVADEFGLSERLELLTDVQAALAGALEGLDGL
jgi:hypothetical protein